MAYKGNSDMVAKTSKNEKFNQKDNEKHAI